MRRFLILPAVLLSLTGCAGTSSFLDVGSSLTASIANPVTPLTLYQVEQATTVAVTGMLAYKRACAAGQIDRSCRNVVATLQTYTRRARPVLTRLRAFVRNNDQVNALTAFHEIRALLADFQRVAAANGAI